jgi:hypothetical protein
MTISRDPFRIDIVLRHPSCTPQSISKALSLKPKGSWAVGQRVTKVPAKWAFFYACLQKGDYISKFEGALTNVVSFLEKHSAFWTDFIAGKGEVELILNHTIGPQEEEGDKCFELSLAPAFMRILSSRCIGLRVQGWQGGIGTKNRRSKKVSRSTKLKAKS